MFAFAPASRVGYFVYPLGLAAWLLTSGASRSRGTVLGLWVRRVHRGAQARFVRRKVMMSSGSGTGAA